MRSSKLASLKYLHKTKPTNHLENAWKTIWIKKNKGMEFEGYMEPIAIHRNFCSTVKALGSIKDKGSSYQISAPQLGLGASGVIPFVIPPLIMYTQGMTCEELVNIQLCYGAVILSFLGGIRWGMATIPGSLIPGSWAQYCWSVIPSLISWAGLMLPGIAPGYLTVISGLGLACYKDVIQTGYSFWFKVLRIFLTLIATLSMTLSLVITYQFTTKKTLLEAMNTTKIQLSEAFKTTKEFVFNHKTKATAKKFGTDNSYEFPESTDIEENVTKDKG